MKLTKRQLKKIIQEEKKKLIESMIEASENAGPAHLHENRDQLRDFEITMTVRVPARSVEYVLNSIEDGMEFDEEIGEGILHYDVKEVPYLG